MEIDLPSGEINIPEIKYEYLDHTADVQIHSWGVDLIEAFEQCGMAMFAYMTDIETVEIKSCYKIEVEADDLENLLFQYLNELLFLFSAENFIICRKLKIVNFDMQKIRIECECYGEVFEIGKHPQGTEVKAITYSAMQIIESAKDKWEIFVIIDI